MESTARPALVLMSGRAIAFLATFLVPLALVRIFDQAGFGTYKQLFLVFATLHTIGQLAMAESLFYFLPHGPRQGGRYVANSVLSLTAAGMAGLALLWAGAPALSRWLGNPELARLFPLLGVFFLLTMPAAALEMVMIARHRYAWGSAAYGLTDVMKALALLLPALVWRRLDALLLGAVAFAAVRLCLALLYFKGEFEGGLRPGAAQLREQAAYALPFALTVVFETLQVNYHHYAVSHRFDAATFAVYAVGCFQIPLLELVASPMHNVMMVRMAERIRDGRPGEAVGIWAGTVRGLALVFLPVLALLLVAAPDLIVFLFTDAYRASVPIFMVWSLTIALSVLPTDSALRVYAATRFLLALSVARVLLIAALIGAALSLLGLLGAVMVTMGVAVPAKAAALARIGRHMGVGLRGLLPWRDLAGIAAVAAAAAVPALVVRSVLAGPLFGRLALTGLVYGASYLVFLFHSGLLAEGEIRAVRSRLPRWRPAPAVGSGS